jgi:hypothetical protein
MTERCVRSCHLVSGGGIRSLIAMKGIRPSRRALTDGFFTRRSPEILALRIQAAAIGSPLINVVGFALSKARSNALCAPAKSGN